MDVLFEKSEKFKQQKMKKNLKNTKWKQSKPNITKKKKIKSKKNLRKKGKITATTNQEEGIRQEQIKKYQNIYELSIEKNMQLLCVIKQLGYHARPDWSKTDYVLHHTELNLSY